MTIHAIVPVKEFAIAKSRLQDVFKDEERAAFARRCYRKTIKSILGHQGVERIWVVSREPSLSGLFGLPKLIVLEENQPGEVNQAIEAGRREAIRAGADTIIVIPTDLPRLTAKEINTVLQSLPEPPCMVIVPDRRGVGTNLLVLSPPGGVPFHFGEDSFRRHCESAEYNGIKIRPLDVPDLALDVDTREDYLFAFPHSAV